VLSGFASICGLMVNIIGCSPTAHPNLVVIDPAKRSDTWALERADIDCKAQVRSEKWFDHLRLRHRVDPIYVSCMEQKGYASAAGAITRVGGTSTTTGASHLWRISQGLLRSG
jgi:hypothetical protein